MLHRSLLTGTFLRQQYTDLLSRVGNVTVPFLSKLLFNVVTLGREPETREHIGNMYAHGPSWMARMELGVGWYLVQGSTRSRNQLCELIL